ncbi:MAG: hypothetical protein L6R42_011038, partial [Xanthoria sp. 1 TBL-2021]
KARAEEARCKNKNTSTSAMAAIGVGVAVGVFALTTACFVLYEVQRRKNLQLAEKKEEEDREGDRGGDGTGKWISKTVKGGAGVTTQQEQQQQQDKKRPRPCGTMNDFSHIARGEVHPAERGQQRHEMGGEPVELESPLDGRYA